MNVIYAPRYDVMCLSLQAENVNIPSALAETTHRPSRAREQLTSQTILSILC